MTPHSAITGASPALATLGDCKQSLSLVGLSLTSHRGQRRAAAPKWVEDPGLHFGIRCAILSIYSSCGGDRVNQENDSRLLPSHECLQGLTLVHQLWKPANPKNDHDHCEFCWNKFSYYADCLHTGYSTEDRESWICEVCFEDFKERFQWRVKG